MSFRENLKDALEFNGILVKELAYNTGISRRTLDNYLRSDSAEPSASKAVLIAKALGVSVEYLVTGQEDSLGHSVLSPEIRSFIQNISHLNENDRKLMFAIAGLFRKQRKK